MKYVYGEGVISRSKRNPGVTNGTLPLRTAYVQREAWVPWKYWVTKVVDHWMHWLQRHVPWSRRLIFETYEIRFDPLFEPEERVTLADIPWELAKPWVKRAFGSESLEREARPPDPQPRGRRRYRVASRREARGRAGREEVRRADEARLSDVRHRGPRQDAGAGPHIRPEGVRDRRHAAVQGRMIVVLTGVPCRCPRFDI